jgi:GTP-binding protein
LIDRVRIYVKGGDGGNGVVSFRHEKYVPFGGPDGGDGGDGGSVFLEGDSSRATLREFKYPKQFRAKRGTHGKGKNMNGRRGEDLVIRVPLGTVVRRINEDGGEDLIQDIIEQKQRVLVAKGGKGGFGNTHYATPTNQAPRTADEGKKGEEADIILDLKLIADVGVIGFPNAGKSTLVGTVSRARPKVADYPFTTLEPVLGVVEIGYRSFVIADIPGIIEGAHQGLGLGLDFLRHIERTKVLIQIIDGSTDTVLNDLRNVENELESYEQILKERPRIIAVNKIDLPEVQSRLARHKRELKGIGIPVYFISAATGEGTGELIKKALELVSRAESADTGPKVGETEGEFKVFRPRPLSSRKMKRRRENHG